MTPYTLWSLRDMLDLPIGTLVATYSRLSRIFHYVGSLPPDRHLALPPSEFEELSNDVNEFLLACRGIDLKATESAASALRDSLAKVERADDLVHFRGAAQIHFKGNLSAVVTCLHHESAATVAFVLPPEKVAYFASASPLYGEEVRDKFPRIGYDLDEAGKCLALGRSTAVVFHLMRILEAGLRAVHGCLGIGVELVGNDRNWGNVLARIREEIRRRDSKWAEKDYFKEIYARLDAVKDAWRNDTMHVEGVYTEDEAKVLFDNTRAFMQKIASRMDGQGNPAA